MNAINTTTDKATKGKEIAGNYDLTLLHDMMEASADAGSPEAWQASYAVGVEYEPSAGIRGATVSPWYGTPEEAYAWCADNEAFLDGMYGEPVRQAQCTYCKRIVEVNEKTRLQHIITPRPDWDMDQMDCGCKGF